VTLFLDDFETASGWTTNAGGTDTATTGAWERGDPAATNSSGPKQLGTTVSGANDLVTGRLAGSAAGDFDVDGGTTTIRSPAIPLTGGSRYRLSLSYYLAHGSNATSADIFRVRVIGATTATVLNVPGRRSTATRDGRPPRPTSARSRARPCGCRSRPPTPPPPRSSRRRWTTCG
jgi:hypothetical protein